jgi:hypothetical protein
MKAAWLGRFSLTSRMNLVGDNAIALSIGASKNKSELTTEHY